MTHRVLISETVAQEGIEYLEEHGYQVKRGHGIDHLSLLEDIQDCDAVLVRVAIIDQDIIEKNPQLKVIAKHGAGYDNIDVGAAEKQGVRVVFAPNANSLSVAEHTMALLLACAKKIPYFSREYANGNPQVRDLYPNDEIHGKCLGLLGLGRIGMAVANMAIHGFGMRVIAYDPFLAENRDIGEVKLVHNRDELLAQADYVSVHIPATPENIKSISNHEFQIMKPTAVLINAARGKIVDETALERAIRNKEIAGAGLDVSDPEPAVPDNPLFHMDEVIMTPHCAGTTHEAMVRMVLDAAKGIDEVFSGREPTYKII